MKKQWYKNTLFTTALLLLIFSILMGVFTASAMDIKSASELKLYVKSALGDNIAGFKQMLYTGLKQNLVFVLFALFGSINIWLFFVFAVLYMFKGFSLGFALAFTLNNFSAGVSVGVIISLLFNIVLLYPIYIASFCLSFKYAVSNKEQSIISYARKTKRFLKKVLIYVAIYIVVIILCCPVAGINQLILKII